MELPKLTIQKDGKFQLRMRGEAIPFRSIQVKQDVGAAKGGYAHVTVELFVSTQVEEKEDHEENDE